MAGARKLDIDWNRMKQRIIADRTKKCAELEQWFSAGELPEGDPYAEITEYTPQKRCGYLLGYWQHFGNLVISYYRNIAIYKGRVIFVSLTPKLPETSL